MKLNCICGHQISDGGDALAHKFHVIADPDWFPLFDAIDHVVTKECDSIAKREAVCTRIRSLVTTAARLTYSCAQCGRLFVDQPDGTVAIYTRASRQA